jgi:hypothetical protein
MSNVWVWVRSVLDLGYAISRIILMMARFLKEASGKN